MQANQNLLLLFAPVTCHFSLVTGITQDSKDALTTYQPKRREREVDTAGRNDCSISNSSSHTGSTFKPADVARKASDICPTYFGTVERWTWDSGGSRRQLR